MNPRYTQQAAVTICLAAALLIFLLPLFVPMRPIAAESASYRAGYNNMVATYAAIGLSVLVFLLAVQFRRVNEPSLEVPLQRPLSTRFISGVLAGSAVIYSVCGWIVVESRTRYLGDAGYIIEQALVRKDTGRHLYSQLEFAYGPLLLLPVSWMSRWMHLSVPVAYFSTLVLETTLGLLMLVYLLNWLPIRTELKCLALLLLASGAITPHLGLNYTFFRFGSPFALLLFGLRRRTPFQCAVVLSIGEALVLLISPELGIAAGMGMIAFGLVCAWRHDWHWLAAMLAPLLTLGVFAGTVGRPYFNMIKLFAAGALNLPIGPYPHVLIILFALVWLVPFGIGSMFRVGDRLSAQLAALYIVSLALMRAALGRSDPLHVFFDGFGLILLSLVVISRFAAKPRITWLTALTVLVLWNQYVSQRQFLERTKYVLAQAVAPILLRADEGKHRLRPGTKDHLEKLINQPETRYTLSPQLLKELSSGGCVATPVEVSPIVEEQLRAAKLYNPGYYAFGVDEMSLAAEERTIQDVNRCHWMLLPANLHFEDQNTTATLHLLQGFSLPYRERNHVRYQLGQEFMKNVSEHWILVGDSGPYSIYEQD